MKSLKRKYEIVRKRFRDYSSFICFVKTVQDGRYKKLTVHRWFNKLINKDDYLISDRKEIIDWLDSVTVYC